MPPVWKRKGYMDQIFRNKPSLLLALLLLAQSLSGCLGHISYGQKDPREAAFLNRQENVVLSYSTNQGRQVAYYLPPLQEPDSPPLRLAIFYPGIESLALGWLPFLNLQEIPDCGYLLIEYPGRGHSQGRLNPEKLFENTEGALGALAAYFGEASIDADLALLGHSFGTGAALQFAARHPVSEVVLVAPYNNLKDAVAHRLGRLIAYLMPAQVDNVALTATILAKPDPPRIVIVHGSKDRSLPVEMGRQVAAVDERVILHEIPTGDHVTVLTTHRDLIFHSLWRDNVKGSVQRNTRKFSRP